MNIEFPPPPEFKPCPKCGAMTAGGGLCFDCARADDVASDAARETRDVIPEELRWATFDAPELRTRVKVVGAIERARAAVQCKRVALIGRAGSGKTSLAVAMLREWVRTSGQPAHFVYAPDLQAARMRTKLGREAEEVVDALASPLLVIDDMGAGSLAGGPLEEVIHKRHESGKSTWITTWMSSETMGARFGGGVARRVYQDARIVDLGGAR